MRRLGGGITELGAGHIGSSDLHTTWVDTFWWLVQKFGDYQERYGEIYGEYPIIYQIFMHSRWLSGISETSTVERSTCAKVEPAIWKKTFAKVHYRRHLPQIGLKIETHESTTGWRRMRTKIGSLEWNLMKKHSICGTHLGCFTPVEFPYDFLKSQ